MVAALVVGYGSIGQRHERILCELGCATAVVSRRPIAAPLAFPDVQSALAGHAPQYVVIANETSQHGMTLETLAQLGYAGTLLVEKPLFSQAQVLPGHAFGCARVAYNLRFHPVLQRLKAILDGERIVTVQAYVGQYLPDWRPGTDYRQSYSADASRGGGVLRDLSHELDYLCWMLGGWTSATALGGHVSALEISSDDAFSLLMTTPRCPLVSVQMNYLDRVARRTITVNTDRCTVHADLIAGTVSIDRECERFQVERDTTYRAMHQALLVGQADAACTLLEALDTLQLIEAAERAARTKEWINK
jgi:predicted dehydrogenase